MLKAVQRPDRLTGFQNLVGIRVISTEALRLCMLLANSDRHDTGSVVVVDLQVKIAAKLPDHQNNQVMGKVYNGPVNERGLITSQL